jgi:hypothetical protein
LDSLELLEGGKKLLVAFGAHAIEHLVAVERVAVLAKGGLGFGILLVHLKFILLVRLIFVIYKPTTQIYQFYFSVEPL